jgi:hypothetical protein
VSEYRAVLSLGVSAIGGALGLHAFPFPADHAILALVHLERPFVYAGLAYTYAALWFTSSFLVASIGLSCLYIFDGRDGRAEFLAPLPPYPIQNGAVISSWSSESNTAAHRRSAPHHRPG